MLYNIHMAEFISSFITGFQNVIAEDLPKRVSGCKILNVYDGLIHYRFDGDSRLIAKIPYFNNNFFVLKIMKGKGLNFPSLVGNVCSEKKYFLINKGTFRVRFNNENQFAKVDKNISKRAEEWVLRNSRLSLDRLSPVTEIWYAIRREGFAYCGQLISKREFTEKNLNKGELRPEIAYLLNSYAEIKKDDVLCDPFSGYGSIPAQASQNFKFAHFYSSDIDKSKIDLIKSKCCGNDQRFSINQCDAFELNEIQDSSVNTVITDPPWGFFEDIGDITEFYNKMFVSFKRILKDDGRMVILSARIENFEEAAEKNRVEIISKFSTLVNGKKATVYKARFL